MGITVKFYRFSKKTNSTKLPDELRNLVGEYDCELLDSTTIQNPGIRLDMHGGGTSPFDFNYAYIEDFKRYYWVNAIEYDLGTWIFSLEVDVLASLRGSIGASSQYIMRSSNTFDGTITDSMYPIKNDFNTSTRIESGETIFGSVDGLSAWYVVGIIGGLSGEAYAYYETYLHLNTSMLYNGSVIYFVLTDAQLRELMSMLLGNVNIYDIETTEMSEALAKQLLNPIQYIESIRCVPFKPDVMAYNDQDVLVDKIQFGFTLMDLNDAPEPTPPTPPGENEVEDVEPDAVPKGWRILRRPRITYPLRNISTGEGWIRHHAFTMSLPVHPQRARGEWVLGQPTSSYTIEMEPFGMIGIPGNVPIQAKKIDYEVSAGVTEKRFEIKFEAWTDVVTGMCKLMIYFRNSSNVWIPFYNDSRDISVTLPCHQSIQDASSYFRTWTNQNAASHNKWLDWITGIFGGISGSYQTQSGAGASSSIGVGAGAVGGIMSFGQSVNNYYRATKPQNMLSMLEANMPQISGNGASGGSYISFASDFCSPRVHCYFSLLADDNNSDHGRPLCRVRQISNIPGYIECDHAHFNDDIIPLSAIEREDAINFMNGGFYYE